MDEQSPLTPSTEPAPEKTPPTISSTRAWIVALATFVVGLVAGLTYHMPVFNDVVEDSEMIAVASTASTQAEVLQAQYNRCMVDYRNLNHSNQKAIEALKTEHDTKVKQLEKIIEQLQGPSGDKSNDVHEITRYVPSKNVGDLELPVGFVELYDQRLAPTPVPNRKK